MSGTRVRPRRDPSSAATGVLSLATERGVTARYALLAGLQEFAIWLPLPVLVLHMTDRGIGLALIGMAFAVRAVLVVLLEVPTGGLADAIGRKPVALASQAATMTSFAFLLVVTGPATLLGYALFQGVGAALHSGALDAWYVDRLKATGPDVDLQRNLAAINVAQTAAMLLGAAIGGTLPALAAGLDLPWPLSGFGVALLAGLLLRSLVWWLTVVLVVEDDRGPARWADALTTPAIVRDGLRLAWRIPVMPWLLFAGGAMGLAMVAIETFWQPIASLTFGADPATSAVYGALGFTLGAAGLLGSLAVMRYGDRFPGGPPALAAASVVVKAGAMLLLALPLGGLGVALGLAFGYFSIAVQNVPHDALLNDAIPNERRSILLSVNSLVFFLGIAVGSGLLGPLAGVAGPRLALGLGAAFTLAAALAYVGVLRARRPADAGVRATSATR